MSQEHPFAQYVRALGKGRHGSRGLSEEEAFQAMSMILTGEVEPIQLGAFLMLMRVKEETPEEVAGAVRAARQHLRPPPDAPQVELDWSSYAGKKRQLPWYLLGALLLAQNGIRVFMHGASGHTAGRIYTRNVLPQLGVAVATSLDEASRQLSRENFAYLDIAYLSPRLHEIIELRPLLGLRSPVHTIARMLNPFNAPYMMQGIFHPGYRDIHQQAARILGQPHMVVIKGEGGEIERNPDLPCLLRSVHEGVLSEEEWPALYAKRHVRKDELDIKDLLKLWHGEMSDEYGEGSIVATVAVALHMMGRARSREEAEAAARAMWEARDRGRLPVAA